MPGFVKRFMLAGNIGWDKYLLGKRQVKLIK
jgi:hypothetical protein